jgi:transcriptional regulator with XRE-family HTH domain
MLMNEKIRYMRQQKGWSQEEMAHRLNMSPNGYGNIERGHTNLNLPKLRKIAAIFDENMSEMFGEDKNIFNSMGDNNTGTQNNQNFCSLFSDTGQCTRNTQVEFNLEKQKLINAQQSNEIIMLRQINELLKEKADRKYE